MDADADDDAVDAEPPSDEATSKAFETLSMERPDDSEDVTAEVLLASRHAALRRLQPPAEAAADDGQGGEDGAAAEGEGVRRASRFQRTAINAAYRTLMLRHGYDPADDSSSAERSATAAQVDLARKQAHLGELALPMAMIQLKAVQDIEKQAAVAPGVGTFTLEALADRARVVLLRAELAGSQAHDASELAAAQLAIVQQHISQGSVDAESSQDETAAVIKRDKTWVTKYKTACEHSDREVRRIVERVRRTLGRLEERLQEPTDEEAAALQNAVLAQQDAAHLTLNAETLLEAAAIEEERRQACRPFAESLLEAVQFDPFPAAAAAAAVAAGGASSAADAANSAAVGGAAAFTAATWASHERLQHEGMTLSTFLDARCVALLRLEQFSSTLVAYADGLFNRPSGARPKDLVESATVAVSIAVGDPAARQGVPGRKLLSKAKLCVAAIFAEDDDGDAARAALSHLQEQPCSSKKKGWCRLCITQASIGDRWEALAEVSGQPCHRGVDLFTHASARPSILVWCARPRPRASARAPGTRRDAPAHTAPRRASAATHRASPRCRPGPRCPTCRSGCSSVGSGSMATCARPPRASRPSCCTCARVASSSAQHARGRWASPMATASSRCSTRASRSRASAAAGSPLAAPTGAAPGGEREREAGARRGRGACEVGVRRVACRVLGIGVLILAGGSAPPALPPATLDRARCRHLPHGLARHVWRGASACAHRVQPQDVRHQARRSHRLR